MQMKAAEKNKINLSDRCRNFRTNQQFGSFLKRWNVLVRSATPKNLEDWEDLEDLENLEEDWSG